MKLWDIYLVLTKSTLLGTVDAPDESAAIAKASARYGQDPRRLIAVRLSSA